MINIIELLILKGVKVKISTPKKLDNIFTSLSDLYLSYLNDLGITIYRTTENL